MQKESNRRTGPNVCLVPLRGWLKAGLEPQVFSMQGTKMILRAVFNH